MFKDENGELLEQSFVVAVMTCAAPMIAFGKEGLLDEQYKELFYKALKELDYAETMTNAKLKKLQAYLMEEASQN